MLDNDVKPSIPTPFLRLVKVLLTSSIRFSGNLRSTVQSWLMEYEPGSCSSSDRMFAMQEKAPLQQGGIERSPAECIIITHIIALRLIYDKICWSYGVIAIDYLLIVIQRDANFT